MKTYVARILCPGLSSGPITYKIRARSKKAARRMVATSFPSGVLDGLEVVR